MWLRSLSGFYCFSLKCSRVSPNRQRHCRYIILFLIVLLVVFISRNFGDFTDAEKGPGGYILRVLKEIQYPEKERPVLLKVRDGILEKELTVTTDVFQNITQDGRHLVYNAYVDGPRDDWIRAFGFTLSKKPETNLRCLFWDTDMNPMVSMESNVTMQVLPWHLERYAFKVFFYLNLPSLAENIL